VTEARDVGQQIKEIRMRLNLTQEQFGQRLGVKKLAVVKYEAGRVPKLSTLNKIARLGGVTVPSLFAGSETTPTSRGGPDVPPSLKHVTTKLIDELRVSASPIWTSAQVRRRFEARVKELVNRCLRDIAEYRDLLEAAERRRAASRKSARLS
jgi:transcriptional regulator with XRE-family HTH domain